MSRTYAHRPFDVVVSEMTARQFDPETSSIADYHEWHQSIDWNEVPGARERGYKAIARRERRRERHEVRDALREGKYDLPKKSVNFKQSKARSAGFVI